ncbi:putative ribonuclease H-like domain-containing protein [Tanacetum coccineum]|uniref:Ribonuclease H-like domain-containing protein n=1 Tax=Tanacetum coccineum TaxID=301880 RepID=A0ABQ5AGH2_9ASTR
MNVSPIPTTRIDKDHPKDQIIRDLTLAIQTRRMTKISDEHDMKVIQALEDPSWIEAMQKELLQFQLQKVWTLVNLPNGKRAIGTKWVFKNKKDERGIVIRNKMDVNSAFLYGTIEEEVYVCQPPGFKDLQFPDKVYKVEKALYGLHQAPKAWYETLSTYLIENRFRRGTIDKTLFIKKDKGLMHKRFQMSSIGELIFFLGLQVQQKEDGIFISQDKYVAEILKKFDFATVKTASTPMEHNKALVKDEEADSVDVHLYRSMIGSLLYLTASRVDITFVVCVCARFQVTPKTSHLQAVKRIFRYLKGQPKLVLWYPRDSPFDVEAFLNSNYVGASLDRKSTTAAEYVAAANCCGQVLWIQNQMLDYGFNFMNTKIYIDNESTICIVKNLVFHSKTKHIEIRHHFIRDSHEKKFIQVIKIHTDHNVADILTKAFDVSRKAKRTTEISQSSGSIHLVTNENVIKEWEGQEWIRASLPLLLSSLRKQRRTVIIREVLVKLLLDSFGKLSIRVDVRTYLLGGSIDSSEANGIIRDPKLELENSRFTFDLVPLSYESVDVVNRILYGISTRSDADLRRLVSFDVFRKARDDRRDTEGREDVHEVFQQRGSGVKRKLSRCGRNQLGNEPILALPKGADDFAVLMKDYMANLVYPSLFPTQHGTFELATGKICTSAWNCKICLCSGWKVHIPADFLSSLIMKADPRVFLILGRPFLQTARALIDVHGEEMILRDGDERLILNMRHDTSSYSNKPKKESINMIDIYNVSHKDYLEDLFANEKATNHQSGNPTFSSHIDLTSPEVINPLSGNPTLISEPVTKSSSSPTLTSLEESDLIWEEFEAYLASDSFPPGNDDPVDLLLEEFTDELALITFPPGNDDLPFDIESDLREIEYLLNNDPTKEMYSILEDSVDEGNLADPNNDLDDTIPEMFTDEHTLDYSSPPLY